MILTLCPDPSTKTTIILGSIHNQKAIVTLDKLPFSLDHVATSDFRNLALDQVKLLDQNDVYYWSVATVNQNLDSTPAVKVNMIYPASETHVKKYRQQCKKLVVETPLLYQQIVVPYIESMKGDRIKWVYNILHDGVEADRVLVRNDDPVNGFVLLPDLKWDRLTMSALYLVAIVLRHDIASLRDLDSSHIPYLTGVRDEILEVVKKTYGLDRSELKIFIHYQPSYYHFHIHVTHVELERHDFGVSILLDNVIDQLKFLGPEGFKQATLTYTIREKHDLWSKGFNKLG